MSLIISSTDIMPDPTQGSVSSKVLTISSGTVTLGFNDHSVLFANGTAITLNLPDPATCTGREYYLTRATAVTQSITLSAPSGTIYDPFSSSSAASITLPCVPFTAHYKSDGMNWFVQSFGGDATIRETKLESQSLVGGAFEIFNADTEPPAYQDPHVIIWEKSKTTTLPVTPCYTPAGHRWVAEVSYSFVIQRIHNAAQLATDVLGFGALMTMNGNNPFGTTTSEVYGMNNVVVTTTSAYRATSGKQIISVRFLTNATAGGANTIVTTNQWLNYPRPAAPRGDFRQGHCNLSYIYKLYRI